MIDTAMVLQLGEEVPPILKAIDGIVAAFAQLADKHRATPMLGRTLLGQLETELSDEAAVLGYSPKFVDRLLADLKRK